MSSSSSSSSSKQQPPQEQQQQQSNNNNTIGMLIMLGMVGASAGFTLYTKRTATMIQQMDQIAKNKARRMPPTKIGPMTKAEWDKVRPRFDKDEFV